MVATTLLQSTAHDMTRETIFGCYPRSQLSEGPTRPELLTNTASNRTLFNVYTFSANSTAYSIWASHIQGRDPRRKNIKYKPYQYANTERFNSLQVLREGAGFHFSGVDYYVKLWRSDGIGRGLSKVCVLQSVLLTSLHSSTQVVQFWNAVHFSVLTRKHLYKLVRGLSILTLSDINFLQLLYGWLAHF